MGRSCIKRSLHKQNRCRTDILPSYNEDQFHKHGFIHPLPALIIFENISYLINLGHRKRNTFQLTMYVFMVCKRKILLAVSKRLSGKFWNDRELFWKEVVGAKFESILVIWVIKIKIESERHDLERFRR